MTTAAQQTENTFDHRHLLSCETLAAPDINFLLDLADKIADQNREAHKKRDVLSGRTLINLFFEASTRTQASFEFAAKRLSADVLNMNVSTSSVQKGETLIDTAMTLNAMRPDIIVVRHYAAGAVELLSQKVDCSVVNAGDGAHQHPTQALLDALTIRRAKGRVGGLTIAICGDILNSRVARSNINVLKCARRQRQSRRTFNTAPLLARSLGGESLYKHVGRYQRRRCCHDAAPPTRTHARHPRSLITRIFPLLRPRPRETLTRQTRRSHHAPRPNESRRRNCFKRSPITLVPSFANRSKWVSPCVWPCWKPSPETCQRHKIR